MQFSWLKHEQDVEEYAQAGVLQQEENVLAFFLPSETRTQSQLTSDLDLLPRLCTVAAHP